MESRVRGRLYKRPFDLMVLVLSHTFPLLVPVWLLLWTLIPLLIWLEDRGSIFYRQKRVGKGGRVFTLVKFRTMRVNQAEGEPTVLATANDPRVTRVGRILRRTALDELPQVLSIFAGHLSIVGPRPEPPDIHEELLRLSPEAHRRLLVRPGFTGLAQVYGGYDARLRDKLRFDLLYIERMGLWLDLKLILLSVWKTMTGRWETGSRKPEYTPNSYEEYV